MYESFHSSEFEEFREFKEIDETDPIPQPPEAETQLPDHLIDDGWPYTPQEQARMNRRREAYFAEQEAIKAKSEDVASARNAVDQALRGDV